MFNFKLNWPCTCHRQVSTSVTYAVCSNQAFPRHMKVPTYRCFLPNLTGFIGFHCAGPDFHCHLHRADLTKTSLRQEFNPAIADCRYRAPLPPHLARPKINFKQSTSYEGVLKTLYSIILNTARVLL
jgi:hypothetical protein